MSERRYDESEVAAIFERATKVHQSGEHQPPTGEGLTLAQLQEIGREVGIAPEVIHAAATGLARQDQPMLRRFFGLPLAVGRTVDLPRKLTDAEWERLVVDLRETFDARGHVRTEGSFRQWTNGNLQALLEPTPNGHRLRLRTLRGQSRSLMTGGLVIGAVGVALVLMSLFVENGSLVDKLPMASLLVMGAGMFGLGAATLPRWARERLRQMADVSERLAVTAGSPPLKT